MKPRIPKPHIHYSPTPRVWFCKSVGSCTSYAGLTPIDAYIHWLNNRTVEVRNRILHQFRWLSSTPYNTIKRPHV